MFLASSLVVLPKALLPAVDESIWYPAEPTDAVANAEPTTVGVNLGLQFVVSLTGQLRSICYYRVSEDMPSSGTAALWKITGSVDDPALAVLLSEVDFSGHSGTGWRVIDLPESVRLSAADGYTAHIWFPSDGTQVIEPTTPYSFLIGSRTSTPWGFIYANADSGALDQRGFVQRNGLIKVGEFDRPVEAFSGNNFWIDVIFNARPNPPPPEAPMILKWPIPEGWPSAETTGVDPDVELTITMDPVRTSSDGQVIENLDARQGILINHNDVTVRNCKVRGTVAVIFITVGTTGTLVQDCELNATGRNNLNSCCVLFAGTDATVERCNMYKCENGTSAFGHTFPVNIIVRDCFIHHLRVAGPGTPHYDGQQWDGGQTNVEITHNTIMNEQLDTSVIMIDNYSGPSDNILVQDNYLCGGGYVSYVDDRFFPVDYPITDVRYLRNIMHPGQYGYFFFPSASGETPLQQGNQFLGHGGIFDTPPPDGFVAGQIVPEGFLPYARNGTGSIIGEIVDAETGGVTVGVSFQIAQDGQISSINFRRPSSASARTYKIGLWRFLGDDLASGVELLASRDFSNILVDGLLNFAFEAPVDVAVGDTLLVGIFIPRGTDAKVWYFVKGGFYWPDPVPSQWGRMTAFSNNPATQPAGRSFGNGLFNYGPDLAPPLRPSGFDASYDVDPIFVAPW